MNDAQREELDQLAANAPGGLLQAENVVAFARNEKTALHSWFEWDDSEAANLYRLSQARQVIRLHVRYEPRVERVVRAYVSVPTDRANGGGYRSVDRVLDRPDWMAQLIEEARKRVAGMRSNYAHVRSLDGLWARLDAQFDAYLAELRDVPKAG